MKDGTEIEELNSNLKRFWEIDDMSVVCTGTMEDNSFVRIEEQYAMKKLEQSIQFKDNIYRVCIPWKSNKRAFPNIYDMTLKRLENTEKKLARSPEIAKLYGETIEQYVNKGYIRKVSEHEQEQSKWFLPHLSIIRLDKETTKTRIVFDSSAKYDGVSLNDVIHQGPKLQQDLFDV